MNINQVTETELISQAQSGDTRALNELVSRHYRGVFQLAYKCLRHQQDAEDIAQDVFVKAAQNLHHFRGRAAFSTWLYRITINTVRDWVKAAARRRAREQAVETKQALWPPPKNDDTSAWVQEAVYRLPEKQREAIILVFSQGLSHQEAALVLDCAETTVSWRIYMAKKELRKLL